MKFYVKLLNNGPLLARYLSTSFPFLSAIHLHRHNKSLPILIGGRPWDFVCRLLSRSSGRSRSTPAGVKRSRLLISIIREDPPCLRQL